MGGGAVGGVGSCRRTTAGGAPCGGGPAGSAGGAEGGAVGAAKVGGSIGSGSAPLITAGASPPYIPVSLAAAAGAAEGAAPGGGASGSAGPSSKAGSSACSLSPPWYEPDLSSCISWPAGSSSCRSWDTSGALAFLEPLPLSFGLACESALL